MHTSVAVALCKWGIKEHVAATHLQQLDLLGACGRMWCQVTV